MFIVRFDAAGGYLWSKWWPSPDGGENIGGLAVDGDGSAIIAGTADCGLDLGGGPLESTACIHNALAAKFDAQGAHVWSRLIDGSASSNGSRIGVDSIGNAFIAGGFFGNLDVDGAQLTAEQNGGASFVVRLDRSGHISWSRVIDIDGNIHGLAVDPEGHVALLGDAYEFVDLGTETLHGRGPFVTKFDVPTP